MLKLAGPVLILFGGVHAVMSLMLFSGPLTAIADSGFFAGSSWSLAMLASFWFLVFTWPIALLGIVVTAAYYRWGDVPLKRPVGSLLIAVPLACGLWLPASGLWAFILPGLMLLFGNPLRCGKMAASNGRTA